MLIASIGRLFRARGPNIHMHHLGHERIVRAAFGAGTSCPSSLRGGTNGSITLAIFWLCIVVRRRIINRRFPTHRPCRSDRHLPLRGRNPHRGQIQQLRALEIVNRSKEGMEPKRKLPVSEKILTQLDYHIQSQFPTDYPCPPHERSSHKSPSA